MVTGEDSQLSSLNLRGLRGRGQNCFVDPEKPGWGVPNLPPVPLLAPWSSRSAHVNPHKCCFPGRESQGFFLGRPISRYRVVEQLAGGIRLVPPKETKKRRKREDLAENLLHAPLPLRATNAPAGGGWLISSQNIPTCRMVSANWLKSTGFWM